MADSDYNWRLWGERDPYYGVLTNPQFHSDNIDQSRADFFERGNAFVWHWLAKLEHRFGSLKRDRALDFGCGVGRLTVPLTDHFGSVVGLDISPGMLEEAARNSEGLNITYALSNDSLSRLEGTFDFVNSCIVLQHIPVARGMPLLAQLLDRVRPGGGCLIQFTTKRNYGWKREIGYRIRHSLPGGQYLVNLLKGRSTDAPMMQMNQYPLEDVMRLFNRKGFEELLVSYQDHDGSEAVTILSRR